MRQIIAEQLDDHTGSVIGARTLVGASAKCLLVGNENAVGVVEVRTECGQVSIRVSGAQEDYQRARVYEDGGKLIESLLFQDGSVVYVNEAADPHPADTRSVDTSLM